MIECSSGTYVRSLIADLGDAYCEDAAADADRAVRRRRRRPGADRRRSSDALAFLPEVRLAVEDARRVSHGVAVPGEARGVVRLTDERGLIALAERGSGDGSAEADRRLRPGPPERDGRGR